jgi:hypothetical protein
MSMARTWRAAHAGVLAAGALAAVTAGAVGAKSSGVPDKGTVFFAVTHTAGGITYAAGNATDKLFGTEAVTYTIKFRPTTVGTVKVAAKATIWGKTGTLSGPATATLTVAKNGAATITNGKGTASHGTGGWTGHSVTIKFAGTGNANTGTYKITYKGTYK